RHGWARGRQKERYDRTVTEGATQHASRLLDTITRFRIKGMCIIEPAHGLGLSATAEGVENEATAALLRELKCDQAQGFQISAPLKDAELAQWMLGDGAEWRKQFAAAPLLGTAS